MTGRASFVKMFQMPVTPTYSATSVPRNPQELRIEYVRPTAIAPPAGSEFATVVVVWVRTADCGEP